MPRFVATNQVAAGGEKFNGRAEIKTHENQPCDNWVEVAMSRRLENTAMRLRTAEWVVITAIFLVLGFTLLPTQTGGEGFFSPDTLDTRSRSTSMLLGIPAQPRFKTRRHELTQYLVSEGYWSPRETGNPHWLLLFRWSGNQRDGESHLQRHVFWKSDKWIAWTEDHPVQAKVLWPRILQILRSDPNESDRRVAELLLMVSLAESDAEIDAALVAQP